jgi:tetratricopeptide (TPR) repeat protein
MILCPALAATAVFLFSMILRADEVILKDGTVLEGAIVKETPERVTIKTGGSVVLVEMDNVLEIRKSLSPDEKYAKKAAALDNTAESQYELGAWCREKKMPDRARKHFEEAVRLDPENRDARRALGFEKVGGKWLNGETLLVAKGYVKLEGKWLKKTAIEEILAARKQEASEYLRVSKMPANSVCLRSRHFFLLSDAPAADFDNLLAMLEQLRDAYYGLFEKEAGLKLAVCDDMAVCVFSGRAPYEAYARTLKLDMGNMTYGYYSSVDLKALTFRNPSNPSTAEMMLHESSHMLFSRAALKPLEWEEGGRLSRWFYEGLAEYFEGASLENGTIELGRPHAGDLKQVLVAFDAKTSIGLPELTAAAELTDLCNTAALNSARINLAYAESWSLVYYLLHGEAGKYRKDFLKFFDRERRGRGGTVSAFRKIFGDPAAMEERWTSFIRERK